MNVASLKLLTRRPPVIVAGLVVVTVLAFLGVNRLVNRFREQEKALARHLYEHGLQAQSAGQPERAVTDFRAALSYARDNFDYQLSLARALRDTGRTAESETYLIGLWERTPQEGAVNLALGRLFAREHLFDKAIQYYHNAIYGLWPGDPETKRRDTEFELIGFLLQHKAYPQAQAELITMAAALPDDPGLRLRVAQLLPSPRTTSMPWPNSSRSCGAIMKIRRRCMAPDRRRSGWAVTGLRKVTCAMPFAAILKILRPRSR